MGKRVNWGETDTEMFEAFTPNLLKRPKMVSMYLCNRIISSFLPLETGSDDGKTQVQ
jgi:hypothetical protein